MLAEGAREVNLPNVDLRSVAPCSFAFFTFLDNEDGVALVFPPLARINTQD
jgi:hypothetical protein